MNEAERLRVVAHELRSLVAALDSLAGSASSIRATVDRRRMLALAVASARDIERILSDPELLSLRLEPVDVGELASSFAAPSVAVRVDGRPLASADPTRLRQAIANLVDNGLRHGSRVDLAVGEEDGRVVVDVRDDGPGVAPGLDPFARGTSTAGSSGLGLWLARAIAEAHGGTLELVANGPGACFRLALPRVSAAG